MKFLIAMAILGVLAGLHDGAHGKTVMKRGLSI